MGKETGGGNILATDVTNGLSSTIYSLSLNVDIVGRYYLSNLHLGGKDTAPIRGLE